MRKRNLEGIMKMIFNKIESISTLFIDEYSYRWYELDVVIDVISLEDADEISPFYLMELNDKQFISEEGINHALIYFDNAFREEIASLLSEPMIDIKDYSMYMSDNIKDDMREFGLILSDDMVEPSNEKEKNILNKCHVAIHEYTQDTKRPRRCYKNFAIKKLQRNNKIGGR